MQVILVCIAVLFALVKVASTVWLVLQPDATTILRTQHGRTIYYAGKASPALFVAAMLVRAHILGDASNARLWAVLLVVAVVAAIVAIRQRAAGTSYGLAHELKRKWRHRR